MNSIARMLAVTGVGLVASTMFAAGPAMAATNSGQSGAKASAATVSSDRVFRYYDTRGECERAGDRGEDRGWWDDFDCYRADGDYVLVVDRDYDNDDWFGSGWDRWFPGIRYHHFDRFDRWHHRGGIGHHGGWHRR